MCRVKCLDWCVECVRCKPCLENWQRTHTAFHRNVKCRVAAPLQIGPSLFNERQTHSAFSRRLRNGCVVLLCSYISRGKKCSCLSESMAGSPRDREGCGLPFFPDQTIPKSSWLFHPSLNRSTIALAHLEDSKRGTDPKCEARTIGIRHTAVGEPHEWADSDQTV